MRRTPLAAVCTVLISVLFPKLSPAESLDLSEVLRSLQQVHVDKLLRRKTQNEHIDPIPLSDVDRSAIASGQAHLARIYLRDLQGGYKIPGETDPRKAHPLWVKPTGLTRQRQDYDFKGHGPDICLKVQLSVSPTDSSQILAKVRLRLQENIENYTGGLIGEEKSDEDWGIEPATVIVFHNENNKPIRKLLTPETNIVVSYVPPARTVKVSSITANPYRRVSIFFAGFMAMIGDDHEVDPSKERKEHAVFIGVELVNHLDIVGDTGGDDIPRDDEPEINRFHMSRLERLSFEPIWILTE